jgi:uncharacterized protein (DUF952 family)/ribosomal protein S18 acetylase RimI-like enzyme
MILHIARGDHWRAALQSGMYDPTVADGSPFIHCSTGRQVRTPWRTLFAEATGLVLLLIDESAIDSPVRYEAPAPGEDGFPHVYGPIPVSAVVAAEPLDPGMATATALPPRIARLIAAARGDCPPDIDEWHHLGYTVSTDQSRIDLDRLHEFLSHDAYWSTGIPRDLLETAFAHSLCFGLSAPDGAQAGFCRVITDRATYGYLADVFVFPEHRGRGLGLWLVQCAVDHPELSGLRSWQLGTRDAHGVYERLGWRAADPARWMARTVAPSDVYGIRSDPAAAPEEEQLGEDRDRHH